MTWVKVEDTFPEHPKVVGLSDGALATWLRGLCYAARNLTDGVIPPAALRLVGTQKATDELVTAGLWNNDMETGGWFIHSYADHQRTRAQIEDERERGRERTRQSRRSNGEHPAKSARSNAGVTPESARGNGAVTVPESEVETESVAEVVTLAPAVAVAEASPSQRDLFGAILDAFAIDAHELDKQAEKQIGLVARDLLAVGATPDDVVRRVAYWRRVKFRGATCTPTALKKWWAQLAPNLDDLPAAPISNADAALLRLEATT